MIICIPVPISFFTQNFLIIGSLSRQVLKKKGDSVNKGMLHNEYKKLAIVAFFLAIMFGLAWIFAILVAIPNTTLSYISQYLFSFLVGFQGLLYFIMCGHLRHVSSG